MKKEEIFNQSVKSALKSGKKIIMLYGNCFVTNIKNRLLEIKDFNEKYFLLFIPASYQFLPYEIYEIPDKFLKACDVFIYQKLDNIFGKNLSSNYIISKLKPKCLKLSVPKFYFKLYFPQYSKSSIFSKNDAYKYGNYPYCIDKNIEILYKNGKQIEQIISILNKNIYPIKFLQNEEEEMLYTMKKLKKSLDIDISDYILSNYKRNILFCDPYHPSESIINEVVKKICKKLIVYYSESDFNNVNDSYICFSLLYKQVVLYLSLDEEVGKIKYFSRLNSDLTFDEYIKMYVANLNYYNSLELK